MTKPADKTSVPDDATPPVLAVDPASDAGTVTVASEDRAVGMDPRIADDTDLLPSSKPSLHGGPDNANDPMKSEKSWVVAWWMKVTFLLGSVVLVGGLGTYKFWERQRYESILIETVMDPLPTTSPMVAPGFELADGEGKTRVNLESLRGKWVFVNFWATWCPPCREEMPSLEYLTRALGDRIEFVAISVDEDWNDVRKFFGTDAPSFKVLWEPRRKISRAYGTEKFPESYLINPEGKVVAKFVGERDWNTQASHQYFQDILAKR